MKNLGGEYLQLFSKNIVATFCHTFEKVVDPKKRISLFKLRQTWNGIIPARKLIAIDKHVHSIDSGWPVMPEPPSTPQSPTIFVNPKFVKPDGEIITQKIEDNEEKDTTSVQEHKSYSEPKQGATNIQEQRKALLEQQRQKRFETEKQMGLHTSESNIPSTDAPPKSAISGSKGSKVTSGAPKRVRFIDEEQAGPITKRSKEDNHLAVSTGPSPLNIRPRMLDLDDLPEELIPIHHKRIKQQVDDQLSTGQINRDEHSSLVENIDKYYELQKKKLADKLSPDKSPLKETPLKQPSEEMQSTGQQNVAEENRSNEPPSTLNILEQIPKGPVNMSDLLSKLVKTGLLPQQQPTDKVEAPPQVIAPPTNTTQPVKSMDEHLPPAIRMNPTLRIPDLHLKIPHLKQFYPSLVDLLYAGEQCSQCGLRFTEVASTEYRSHLDWHFQLNRKDKDGLRKISRNWFIHPDDWYALKEGEQIEDKVKSNIFEQEQLDEEQKVEDGNISCKVLPGEGNEACHLCGESFEQFWEEDLEEWHFKDAVRTSEGILYHGDCRREAKDSEVPQTPVTPIASDIIPKEEFEKARTKASTDIDR